MAKLAATLFALRILQFALALAFLILWSWAIGSHFQYGGGPGEAFFGFFLAIASLGLTGYGIYSWVRKHFQKEHSVLYYNAQWIVDLLMVAGWVGWIVILIVIPIPQQYSDSQFSNADSMNSPSLPYTTPTLYHVGLGVNICSLFSAITMMITSLLHCCIGVRGRRRVASKNVQVAPAHNTPAAAPMSENSAAPAVQPANTDHTVAQGIQTSNDVHVANV